MSNLLGERACEHFSDYPMLSDGLAYLFEKLTHGLIKLVFFPRLGYGKTF